LTDLSKIDDKVRFDAIDFLTDIESERLTYLGRTMFARRSGPGSAVRCLPKRWVWRLRSISQDTMVL
jgi:hypothetical protein